MMELTRRRFFQALAASALAAGVPLPIGMPVKSAVRLSQSNYLTDADHWLAGQYKVTEREAIWSANPVWIEALLSQWA